jgi:hypothetical protein
MCICVAKMNSQEIKSLEKAKQFIKFFEENDRFPTSRTNDPFEHSLGIWIVQMRVVARRNRESLPQKHGHMALYESVKTLLDTEVPDWVDGAGLATGNRESHSIRRAKDILHFFEKNNRFPVSTPGTPLEERRLAQFLNRMRMACRQNRFIFEKVKEILDTIPHWLEYKKEYKRILRIQSTRPNLIQKLSETECV